MSSVKISDRKRYWQFLWRSWAIQDSWNYERQMNMGFLFGIAPTLDQIGRASCRERVFITV